MKFLRYLVLGVFMILVPVCLSVAGGDEIPPPPPGEEVPGMDGAYTRVDPGRQDVLEVFAWLKEELAPRGFTLTGDRPLEARMQVVAGYKYILLCDYIDEETGREKRLLARVYRRSDGVTELQELEPEVE